MEYDLGKFNLNIVEKTSPNKRIEVGGKVVDIFYPDSFEIEVDSRKWHEIYAVISKKHGLPVAFIQEQDMVRYIKR